MEPAAKEYMCIRIYKGLYIKGVILFNMRTLNFNNLWWEFLSPFFFQVVTVGCLLALLPLLTKLEFIAYIAINVSFRLKLAAVILSGHPLLNNLGEFTYKIMTKGLIFFLYLSAGLIPLALIISFSGLEYGLAFIQARVYPMVEIWLSNYIKNRLDLHSTVVESSSHSDSKKNSGLMTSIKPLAPIKCQGKSLQQMNPDLRKFYSTINSSGKPFNPEVTYTDILANKSRIFKENKGKSGIYIWKNNKTNQIYIGSSKDIGKRLYNYFSKSNLLKNKSMLICRSLLKHGYSLFSISILETCTPAARIERENYYLGLLKPQYNVLKVAGLPPMDPKTTETKIKMRLSSGYANKLVFKDTQIKDKLLTFNSKKEACLMLDTNIHTLNRYIRKVRMNVHTASFKGRYDLVSISKPYLDANQSAESNIIVVTPPGAEGYRGGASPRCN